MSRCIYADVYTAVLGKEKRMMQHFFSGLLDCLFMAMFMALTMMVTLAYGV